MWLDEFFTFFVAQQPSVAESVRAVREGADTAPPLHAILVKFAQYIFGPRHVALRLPAFAGFCLACWCIFGFMKRRVGAYYAVAATMIFAMCAYGYATEGRAYGLCLGFLALALRCWQAAAEPNRRVLSVVGLGACLATAIALHYYSVFVLIPLGIAELSRWVFDRKLDFGVLAALIAAPVVLVAHLPLIVAGRQFLQHFWQRGSLAGIPDFYRSGIPEFGLWAMGALIVIGIGEVFRWDFGSAADGGYSGLRRHEWVACIGLTLLPAIGIPIALAATTVGRASYFFPVYIGIAMLVAASLFTVARGRTLPAIAVCLSVGVWLGGHSLHNAITASRLRFAASLEKKLVNVPATPEPILINDPHAFVELWYYGDPQIRRRVFSLFSVELASEAGNDSVARDWEAIVPRVSIPVYRYETFIESKRAFLMADDLGMSGHLRKAGYVIQPLKGGIYLVEPGAK